MTAAAGPEVSLLDVVELDMGYTTITDHYYETVSPQRLLDGARSGLVAYLRSRGIEKPNVPTLHARPDGRGVVPAIEQQLGKTIERYGARVDVRGLVYGVIRGELAALHDPYSIFFTKAELHGFTTALDGAPFGGVGVVLARDPAGRYVVDQVFDGGPAGRAGVAPGDVLIAVGDMPVSGLATAKLSVLLHGPVGTPVDLSVLHAGATVAQTIAVIRAAVIPPDVAARELPDGVGYLALRAFGPDAGRQVRAALSNLRKLGARAIVFDLRGNGGGYESSAVHVASAFVAQGAIVSTQSNHGSRTVTTADGSALAPLPLVLLVDHDSASASELVTGAIADHHVGTIIGMRTFGKGVVQSMFPLPDGAALKVTTARYFTPSGHDIDRVGITPDVEVSEPADAVRGVPGRDAQLDAALALLRSAPANAAPAPVAPATFR